MEKTSTNFRMKEGAVIVVKGTRESYSNHNLTDAIAVRLLSENINRKDLFVKVPEDLEDLIAEHNAAADTKDTGDGKQDESNLVAIGKAKVTIEQALEIVVNAKLTTKAKSKDGLEAAFAKLKPAELKKLEKIASNLEESKAPPVNMSIVPKDTGDGKPGDGDGAADQTQLTTEQILTKAYADASKVFDDLPGDATEDQKSEAIAAIENAEKALTEFREKQ